MMSLQFITPLIEIAIIAISINYLLSFFWNTKSLDIIWGVFIFILLFSITTLFNLPILHKIMIELGSAAVISCLIIFQPEIRIALSKLTFKDRRQIEITEFDKFLILLANSVYRLAEKRIGALIVLEKDDSLDEYAQKAVIINGNFSSELLETIFATTTPLHDGAVIIRENVVLAAASILPLAENSPQITNSMGTRHRAALGLSLLTDALIIVISEESGKISIAREGLITRGIKIERFNGIIKSIFNSSLNPITFQNKLNFTGWLKK